MIKKRYSIVRVDNSCPAMLDDFGCIIARNMLHCKCGEDTKNYGDTKEQMIRKIAQILFKNAPKETYQPRYIEQKRKILEVATKIVEFLGVEN